MRVTKPRKPKNKHYNLRVSDELFQAIEVRAERNSRSVNSEISRILERHFLKRKADQKGMSSSRVAFAATGDGAGRGAGSSD